MKKDFINKYGLFGVSVFAGAILCLFTKLGISGTGIEGRTILEYAFLEDKSKMLISNNFYTPMVWGSLSLNKWYVMFLPLLVSFPFFMQFSCELTSGFYRMRLIRIKRKTLFRKMFTEYMIFGCMAVLTGYLLFALFVAIVFPHDGNYQLMNELMVLLRQMIILVTFAGIMAEVVIFLYLLTGNGYRAIGVPMIMLYLMDQISLALFYDNNWKIQYYAIGPTHVLFQTAMVFEGIGLNMCWYFVLVLILGILLYKGCFMLYKRRTSS